MMDVLRTLIEGAVLWRQKDVLQTLENEMKEKIVVVVGCGMLDDAQLVSDVLGTLSLTAIDTIITSDSGGTFMAVRNFLRQSSAQMVTLAPRSVNGDGAGRPADILERLEFYKGQEQFEIIILVFPSLEQFDPEPYEFLARSRFQWDSKIRVYPLINGRSAHNYPERTSENGDR